MAAYYNEHDPFAAAWLRELIRGGHIADGDVDEQDIRDVLPSDLTGYAQCHFFAGIGGWSYALRLAKWPDDQPVWTGSCPCQPFSAAGRNGGFADARHLWPSFFHLIGECRPAVIFGEQVASKDGLAWLDLVQSDMEGTDYAFGATDLCAASIGAPHIRQRRFFVAHAGSSGLWRGREHEQLGKSLWDGAMADADGRDASAEGLQRSGQHGKQSKDGSAQPWRDVEWLHCSDGKARPTKPGIFPLAHGVRNRLGILRGAGNAIVPQVAAEFIKATTGDQHV